MPQQATIGPAPMERIERTNVVVVRESGQDTRVPPRRNLFAMDIDRGRNCYACRGFGHIVIAQGCRQTLGLGLVDKIRTVVNY